MTTAASRPSWRRVVAAATAGLALVAVTSLATAAAASARAAKPTVSGFSASPSAVGSGGTVTLSATVVNASVCTFSSKQSVPGLPATVRCAGGTVSERVVMPTNTGKRAAVYTLILSATGHGGTRRAPAVKVTVANGATGTPPANGTPPASTPEAPVTLALPAAAVVVFGGSWTVRRRRRRISPS